jgi:hypothetical protein
MSIRLGFLPVAEKGSSFDIASGRVPKFGSDVLIMPEVCKSRKRSRSSRKKPYRGGYGFGVLMQSGAQAQSRLMATLTPAITMETMLISLIRIFRL